MQDRYKEAKKLTNAVINIYRTLAKLEKNQKENSNEYKDLCNLLPKAIEFEKRDYHTFLPKKIYIKVNQEVLEKDTYFLLPSEEKMSALRALSYLDVKSLYSIQGSKVEEPAFKTLQEQLESNFYCEIINYLPFARKLERETLIDYKYMLLAILEENPKTIAPPSVQFLLEEENRASLYYIFPIVKELSNKLFGMSDKEINEETILKVLYLKSALLLLPPLYRGVIEQENRNALQLKRTLEPFTRGPVEQICNLLKILEEKRNYKRG